MREHVRPAVTRAEEVVANASGENFPVALRLLPERYRRHLTALYCFARLTDDLGDQARENGQSDADLRLRLLDELTADVHRIYEGKTPGAPVMQQMASTVNECKIPAQPLLDLIQANRRTSRSRATAPSPGSAGTASCPPTRWARSCCTSSVPPRRSA